MASNAGTFQGEARLRAQGGFTMAEMIAVVAIVVVVGALAFMSLTSILRDMQQAELDGTAREMFVSAQNHLSAADSLGLVELKSDKGDLFGGELEEGREAGDIRCFAVDGPNDPRLNAGNNVLSEMLPYGSVNESVRTGGTYVIQYDWRTATVLAVFYASKGSSSLFSASASNFAFTSDDYARLFPGCEGDAASAVEARRNYPDGTGAVMIGYYGGQERDSLKTAGTIERPVLRMYDDERLMAVVRNPLYESAAEKDRNLASELKPTLQLVVTGETSGNVKVIPLITAGAVNHGLNAEYVETGASGDGSVFYVYLDDIAPRPGASGTQESAVWQGHFDDLFGQGGRVEGTGALIPGENVLVQAKLFSTTKLANVALSTRMVRNSLFEAVEGTGADKTAIVSNMRHLENIAHSVSGFDPADGAWRAGEDATGGPMAALQVSDLSWPAFQRAIAKDSSVIASGERQSDDYDPSVANSVDVVVLAQSAQSSAGMRFAPVDAPEGFVYDGGSHRISDVEANGQGDAGLFSAITKGGVRDVELVNFTVAAGGDAGALAGEASGADIEGVLVRNEVAPGFGDSAYAITASGDVGGLVGRLKDGGSISQCAASVYVRGAGSGSAGGLVGSVDPTSSVAESYSGGHTSGGQYTGVANVLSTGGTSGGLVGTLAGRAVDCYSTCSAGGVTAGGFAGSVERGASIADSAEGGLCYATGKVEGHSVAGAFVGSNFGSISGRYFGAMNSDRGAVGSGIESSAMLAADADTARYKELAGAGAALPYDTAAVGNYGNLGMGGVDLARAYDATYPFKCVAELIGAEKGTLESLPAHLKMHYGDWPVMDWPVLNHKS